MSIVPGSLAPGSSTTMRSKNMAVKPRSPSTPLLPRFSFISYNRYDELLCRKVYEEDPNFRWCTNRTCSTGQIIEGGRNIPTSNH